MSKKKIIVFGTGAYFQYKKENLLKKYEVILFLDNRIPPEETEKSFLEIPIKNPECMDRGGTEDIFLMSIHYLSMWRQLISLGISPERIVHPFFEQPYFQSDEITVRYVDSICFSDEAVYIKEKYGNLQVIQSSQDWQCYLRLLYRREFPLIQAIADMESRPISCQFAAERGTPVDRFYIDKFLEENARFICGDVLEIEDATYTKRYGKKVRRSIVTDVSSHADGISYCMNLETGEGVQENVADCFILTQTMMYIFNLPKMVENISRILKIGGVALITCSGISQNSRRCMDQYGAKFNFNVSALEKLFQRDGLSVLKSGSYGNAKTVLAHLAGLCQEDLKKEDFKKNDPYYPLIVYAVVKKHE